MRAEADAPGLAERWARVVEAAHDPVLAVGYLRAEMAEDPERVAAALDVVLSLVAVRQTAALGLLVAVGAALAPRDMAERRARLAGAASALGLGVLADILGPREAVQGTSAGGEPADGTGRTGRAGPPTDDDRDRVPDFGRGRPLALGERKSLARGRDRQLLARVIRDPHPDVIRILLENPALTQDDVVRLVARRPVAGDVLREVASSVRWIARGPVRSALLKNPYAPLDIALPLVPLATSTELADLAASPELSTPLRVLAERGARPVTLH